MVRAFVRPGSAADGQTPHGAMVAGIRQKRTVVPRYPETRSRGREKLKK
jgi:hypothetical protein